jgi:hypothetical protein
VGSAVAARACRASADEESGTSAGLCPESVNTPSRRVGIAVIRRPQYRWRPALRITYLRATGGAPLRAGGVRDAAPATMRRRLDVHTLKRSGGRWVGRLRVARFHVATAEPRGRWAPSRPGRRASVAGRGGDRRGCQCTHRSRTSSVLGSDLKHDRGVPQPANGGPATLLLLRAEAGPSPCTRPKMLIGLPMPGLNAADGRARPQKPIGAPELPPVGGRAPRPHVERLRRREAPSCVRRI